MKNVLLMLIILTITTAFALDANAKQVSAGTCSRSIQLRFQTNGMEATMTLVANGKQKTLHLKPTGGYVTIPKLNRKAFLEGRIQLISFKFGKQTFNMVPIQKGMRHEMKTLAGAGICIWDKKYSSIIELARK